MTDINRRNALRLGAAFTIPPAMAALLGGYNPTNAAELLHADSLDELTSKNQKPNSYTAGDAMKIQYLEIVTPEVDGLCKQYAAIYDITFSEPIASFGGARTAKLDGGGMLGIRGPMRDTEEPVVRPYLLVEDIKAAVDAAAEAGAKVAMAPMEIPDHGKFAIVIHGGIDCGFWEN